MIKVRDIVTPVTKAVTKRPRVTKVIARCEALPLRVGNVPDSARYQIREAVRSGRPRKYATLAAKQKAYRERKKARD